MTDDAVGWQPWAVGDRYVWTGTGDDPLVFTGEFVHDGPAPFVTVRHDGDNRTSQVYAAQLLPEADRG